MGKLPSRSYHKFREWGGPKFGTRPNWVAERGKYDPIEPFPDACGDCGGHKDNHISELTHAEKIQMLEEIAEDARRGAEKTQELIYFLSKGAK